MNDAETMEETLHAYQPINFRQNGDSAKPNEYRSRSAAASAPVYQKIPRAVKAIRIECEESDPLRLKLGQIGSDAEEFQRKISVTTASDQSQIRESNETDCERQIGMMAAIASEFLKPAHTTARKDMMIADVRKD